MFDEALRDLVGETGAEFAIFCDYEGESIALASRGVDEFEVRIAGAQLGATVIESQKLVSGLGHGERLGLLCSTERLALVVDVLPGAYYLLASTARFDRVPLLRHRLRAVGDLFAKEL